MEIRKIVWQSSFNTTEVVSVSSGIKMMVKGDISGELKGAPLSVQYELEIDNNWIIQSVQINVKSHASFTLYFKKDKTGMWHDASGMHVPDFDSCIDIDISLTPFTNTLPINRLRLAEGKSKEITVLYFNLPEPEIKAGRQRYTNLGNGCYKYENLESGFTSVIETNQEGIVTNYPGLWRLTYPENVSISENQQQNK